MDSLNIIILHMHQVFYAILAVVFCAMALAELGDIKQRTSLETRRYFTPIFCIIFFGLLLSFLQSWNGMGLAFSLEFALFISLGLLSPKYAASFFLFILLTRPWETFSNQMMETMPRDIFYLAMLSLIGHKMAKRDYSVRINLGTVLTGLFALWVFFSAFYSNHSSIAVLAYAEVFSKGIIIFFLIQNCFEKAQDLLAAKAALVLAIIEMGLVSARNTFVKNSTVLEGDEYQRLESIGILANSNDIAAILILALPFCFFFFMKKEVRKFLWPLSIGAVCLIIALIWSSQSRGALLALIATFAAYWVTKIKSKKALVSLGIASVLCATLAFSLLKRRGGDLEGSTNNRIIYWMAGVNMAARNPVFGVGFWGFNDNFASYAVGGNIGTEGKKMTAHSAWVQVLAENGFFGFFLFVSLWVYGGYRAWLVRNSDPEYFMGLVGYGVAITFLSHSYLMYPYILLSLSITQSYLLFEGKKSKLPLGKNTDLRPSLSGGYA